MRGMSKVGRTLAEMPQDVLTVPEVAEVLRISPMVAYQQVRQNRIPTIKFGRRILVPREALVRMLRGENGGND